MGGAGEGEKKREGTVSTGGHEDWREVQIMQEFTVLKI